MRAEHFPKVYITMKHRVFICLTLAVFLPAIAVEVWKYFQWEFKNDLLTENRC
jgi:hypothetical protein